MWAIVYLFVLCLGKKIKFVGLEKGNMNGPKIRRQRKYKYVFITLNIQSKLCYFTIEVLLI